VDEMPRRRRNEPLCMATNTSDSERNFATWSIDQNTDTNEVGLHRLDSRILPS